MHAVKNSTCFRDIFLQPHTTMIVTKYHCTLCYSNMHFKCYFYMCSKKVVIRVRIVALHSF